MDRRNIMVVEDEAIVALKIKADLLKAGHAVHGIYPSGEAALEAAKAAPPDLALMDIQLQGKMSGIETAEMLKNELDVPVIFMTAHSDESTIEKAALTAPYGYLLKPVDAMEMLISVQVAALKHKADKEKEKLLKELKEALEEVRTLSRTDSLTGALNRRAFCETLEAEFASFSRHHRPFSLVYIDLDNFKSVNDTMGHSEGDRLLKCLMDAIRATARESDAVARLGGDELAVLMPETDNEQSEHAVSRIIARAGEEMRKMNWPVTLSAGVITCVARPPSVDSLLSRADALMYEVKKNGKNGTMHAILSS